MAERQNMLQRGIKVSPITSEEQLDEENVSEIASTLIALQWENARQAFLEFKTRNSKSSLENFDIQDETVLHLAVKNYDGSTVLRKLISNMIKSYPGLLTKTRTDREYQSQTPLHIALAKEATDIVEDMLKIGSRKLKTHFSELLAISATGTKFKNTVMMGQLPLSVAALTLNTNSVELFLDKQLADIKLCNKHGDTVLHSLIKYAAIYPEKVTKINGMLEFLHSRYINTSVKFTQTEEGKYLKYEGEKLGIWFMTNHENYTPLQLAARLGVVGIVRFILDLKDVYFFVSAYDGLFDIKMYDITEVDSLTNQQMEMEMFSEDRNIPEGVSKKNVEETRDCWNCCGIRCRKPKTKSITEMLFSNDYDNSDAFQILQLAPVRKLIEEKWRRCRIQFGFWGCLHFILMVFLTTYNIMKADIDDAVPQNIGKQTFMDVSPWIAVLFGVLYFLVAFIVVFDRLRRELFSNYWMKDIQYVIILLVFAICIFIHAATTGNYVGDVTLSIALVMGWSFIMFFLRPTHTFSFFTELMKQVILKDFVSFAVIIMLEFFAFSASMYSMLRLHPGSSNITSDTSDHYSLTIGTTFFMMFKLMIGLEDIDLVLGARVPWYAVTLYIAFVLLTYILLFNALIGIMSNTSSLVEGKRYEYWKIQQLSVVLFLEELTFWLPNSYIQKMIIGDKIKVKNSFVNGKRWFLQMHYLDETKHSTDEKKILTEISKSEDKSFLSQLSMDTKQTQTEDKSTQTTQLDITIIEPDISMDTEHAT